MMERLQVKKPIYPLVCIAFAAIILLGGLLVSKRLVFAYLLAVLCLMYPCFGYGKVLLKCLTIFIPLSLLIGLLSWPIAGNRIAALQTTGRILLMGLCAVPMVSLPPVNLTRCLTQLNCPRILTLGMLVAVRFVPVLMTEMRRILEAMKTRGVRLTLNPACFYRAFLIPLVMRLTNISEILALSLETRGFDLKEKDATVYRPVRFTLRDAAFSAVTAALVVGMAVAR